MSSPGSSTSSKPAAAAFASSAVSAPARSARMYPLHLNNPCPCPGGMVHVSGCPYRTMCVSYSTSSHLTSSNILSEPLFRVCSPIVKITDQNMCVGYLANIYMRCHYKQFHQKLDDMQLFVACAHYGAPQYSISELEALIASCDAEVAFCCNNDPEAHSIEATHYRLLLADMLFYGMDGTIPDKTKAIDLYKHCASIGHPQAIIWLTIIQNSILLTQLHPQRKATYNSSQCILTPQMRHHEMYHSMIYMIGLTLEQGHISPYAISFVEQSIHVCGLLEQLPLVHEQRFPGATMCLSLAQQERMIEITGMDETRENVRKIRMERMKRTKQNQKKKAKKKKKKQALRNNNMNKDEKDRDEKDATDETQDGDNDHHDPQNPFSLLSLSNSLPTPSRASIPSNIHTPQNNHTQHITNNNTATATTNDTKTTFNTATSTSISSKKTTITSTSSSPLIGSSSWSSYLSPSVCLICTDDSIPDPLSSVCHPTHVFHSLCLSQWIETCQRRNWEATCPICRTIIPNQ